MAANFATDSAQKIVLLALLLTGYMRPTEVLSVDCNSANVIYLLTCCKCKLQYVGETVQLLRERIRHHVSSINHPDHDHNCRILRDHFSKGLCKNATFTVNIIEKLPGNGRDNDGNMDPAVTRIRKRKETNWMLKLRTVFPFGLNDRVGDEYMTNRDHCNVSSKFPSLKRTSERLKVRTKHPISSNTILDHFIYIINESFHTNLRNTRNLIRVLLSSLKKSSCRILVDRINDFLYDKHDSFPYFHYFHAALDILQSKIGEFHITSAPIKSPPSNRCHILFSNKAIDFINIHKILRDKDVRSSLPNHLRKDTPTVIYKLTDTIRTKLFNYKDFVQSIDVDAFLADNSILPCDCQQSAFVNSDHGHVISGDLNIVNDVKLRHLISKGPKYREPLPFSYAKAKLDIMTVIENCIDDWSMKEGIPKAAFLDWKHTIANRIEDRIKSSIKNKRRTQTSVFKNSISKLCLSDLQSKYVMVPIDKATSNVAFICKRFYALTIIRELGIDKSSSVSSTYSAIHNNTLDDIVERQGSELKELFNITVENNMLTLPDIYWIPKLHKNPVKFRFIIASKRCTTKVLSKNVSSAFTLFLKQIEKYNMKSYFYSGIKSFWIVKNRDPVLNAVTRSVTRRSAKCISSFDFSTLYTQIPHDKLIDVLHKIINFAFKGGTRNKLAITKSGSAYWSNNLDFHRYTFTKESITCAVSYLSSNCYFRLGDKLFRQDIGIPMGSDPAPAFANLFLFHYESSWLKSIKKDNYILARKFGQVFRYIDDLLALNDGHSFEAFHRDIYPIELQLNKENTNNSSTNFLDLNIEIENGVFTTKLFDKRDHFGFHITRLPYKDSNIPYKMFYSSITAECLRVCRATTSSTQAVSSLNTLLDHMIKQGADKSRMKVCLNKTFNRHQVNHKFGIQDNSLINMLFPGHFFFFFSNFIDFSLKLTLNSVMIDRIAPCMFYT